MNMERIAKTTLGKSFSFAHARSARVGTRIMVGIITPGDDYWLSTYVVPAPSLLPHRL